MIESCVTPQGTFQYGIHKPSYSVTNLRSNALICPLGTAQSSQKNQPDETVYNTQNFPVNDINVTQADWIYEIPNAFSFRGRTFIDKEWADSSANNPHKIRLEEPGPVSLTSTFQDEGVEDSLFAKLPPSMHLALATCSTDPDDLIKLARLSCDVIFEGDIPQGLRYTHDKNKGYRPIIHNHALFEAVANNIYLPDSYKIVMVIRPGAQGGSEIVGDYNDNANTHVYEYLRRNSYIPGGHYAANMAEDAIRYSMNNLTPKDIQGLRHLYYQRTFIRLAQEFELPIPSHQHTLPEESLEKLRQDVLSAFESSEFAPATLWGWNFGFDFAPSLYRLHASHQQIHQQYALVSDEVERFIGSPVLASGKLRPYNLGDQVSEFVRNYNDRFKSEFFRDYLTAIHNNSRMDDRVDLNSSLTVWEDDHVIVFVPKAQTSQWELQLMTLPQEDDSVPGNILECDSATRRSLDRGILAAQKALAGLGAKMITSIEYSKRINDHSAPSQPLIYAFLPRLPESPGAFSEAQLRFINGHYPEDFAAVCKEQLDDFTC